MSSSGDSIRLLFSWKAPRNGTKRHSGEQGAEQGYAAGGWSSDCRRGVEASARGTSDSRNIPAITPLGAAVILHEFQTLLMPSNRQARRRAVIEA